GRGRGTNTVSLPALRAGNVAVVSATLLARHDSQGPQLTFLPKSGFQAAEASYATAVGQLAYYRALERRGLVRILTDWPSLETHVHEWLAYLEAGTQTAEAPPLGFLISMEGADPILAPDDLDLWWESG